VMRQHAASRMIRRNTNRRHMIDDHHGPSARRANLLVRAVDGILGTHRKVTRTDRAGVEVGPAGRSPQISPGAGIPGQVRVTRFPAPTRFRTSLTPKLDAERV